MNKIKILITILFFNSSFIFAQGENMAWDSKFALAGGFISGAVFPDYSGINKQLTNLSLKEFSSSGIITTGGAGHVSLPFLRNFRIGGIGFGGSTTVTNEIAGRKIEANYSSSFGGFTMEYTFPFISKVALSTGIIIGGGNITIDIYDNDQNFEWNEIWNGFQNDPPQTETQNNFYKKLSNSFFSVAPTLNLDIPYKRFFAFRIGAGYKFAVNENWKADNGIEIKNIPAELNNNSFFIQVGIFAGFFNY